MFGASGVVHFALSYFLSHQAADAGKRIEPNVWKSWGGPPTTRLLRHTNSEFNRETRLRVHSRLRELGLCIPTDSEEATDIHHADLLYESAADELRRLTRNRKRFPLVFHANVEYGFRRNLLGLKKFGIAVAVISLSVNIWPIVEEWLTLGAPTGFPVATALVTSLILLGWIVGTNPDKLRISADRYARFLLEAACELESS